MSKIEELIQKGVRIPNPLSVEIGNEVDLERISGNGVVIYSGCKIYGSSTLILQNASLGHEGSATIENCQLGPHVKLNGGFFKRTVFLDKASAGYGAHMRDGTILEEESSVAHTVGLKQTVLFPFVTLGSLINFCDCLMSGGTSRKDHSEVGSSYIHFNYTPSQDKATPSLIGDVPGGVMLNRPPIFLGGQGGLVGPCRLAFGTVIAAGSICRKDELRPMRLIIEGGGRGGNIPFTPGRYQNLKRILTNNCIYIANLISLRQWYFHVRSMFVSDDFPESLLGGLKFNIDLGIDERIKKLDKLCFKVKKNDKLSSSWPVLQEYLNEMKSFSGDKEIRDTFLGEIDACIKEHGRDYLQVIKRLDQKIADLGTAWLQGIVDYIVNNAKKIISI